MHYYAKFVERPCADAQEIRQMALIRRASISWLTDQLNRGAFKYVFRDEAGTTTHIFVDAPNHQALHDLLDPDPLISYCYVDIEPLLLPTESAKSLEVYLNTQVLSAEDWDELQFENRPAVDDDGEYYLARKTIKPFSPLLTQQDQNRIHLNTLNSQTAHADEREIVDYNPVGKPVGILIMKAASKDEVLEHVTDCDVFIDSLVEITRLHTLKQAHEHNNKMLSRYMIGQFRQTESLG